MKKNNPFKDWQKSTIENRLRIIKEKLRDFDRVSLKFESVNKLAIALAMAISDAEELQAATKGNPKPAPISKTTLTRNKECYQQCKTEPPQRLKSEP